MVQPDRNKDCLESHRVATIGVAVVAYQISTADVQDALRYSAA
jgi:hypothetical protein